MGGRRAPHAAALPSAHAPELSMCSYMEPSLLIIACQPSDANVQEPDEAAPEGWYASSDGGFYGAHAYGHSAAPLRSRL